MKDLVEEMEKMKCLMKCLCRRMWGDEEGRKEKEMRVETGVFIPQGLGRKERRKEGRLHLPK